MKVVIRLLGFVDVGGSIGANMNGGDRVEWGYEGRGSVVCVTDVGSGGSSGVYELR